MKNPKLKPFYNRKWVAKVFKSVHQDEDYVVLVGNSFEIKRYFRVCAENEKEAANKAFERYEFILNEELASVSILDMEDKNLRNKN